MDSMKSKHALIALAVLVIVGVGGFALLSGDDDDMDKTENQSTSQQSGSTAVDAKDLPFNLSLTNLAPLDSGVYEGWVVRGDDKLSFGRFNMTADGMVDGTLAFDSLTVQDGDTIAISIEPDTDPDPGPSATIVLAGEVMNGSANLAFPVDVSGFGGQYILATPTTAAQDDETAGVWFTITGSDTSLDIPVAPDGWIYEGWAVVDGTPYTTGQFKDPSMADMFNGYSGPGNAPNKPGEDFVANLANAPLDLRGGTIVVSLEPYQDGTDPTGEGPAQVKPLTHMVPADAVDHSALTLEVSTESVPSGMVTL